MSLQETAQESTSSESLWTLAGVLLGTLAGSLLGDVGFGVAVGLMIGAIVTMALERRRKKKNHSVLMLSVGVIALLCIISFRIIKAM